MKKSELPQDKSQLENFTREVCYVKNENGSYEACLSTGWEVKKVALENAWEDINEKVQNAVLQIKEGNASPILYYMELSMMDFKVLAGYTGFYRWQIKRHLKPRIFNSLSNTTLQRYADAFDISVEKLKDYNEFVRL